MSKTIRCRLKFLLVTGAFQNECHLIVASQINGYQITSLARLIEGLLHALDSLEYDAHYQRGGGCSEGNNTLLILRILLSRSTNQMVISRLAVNILHIIAVGDDAKATTHLIYYTQYFEYELVRFHNPTQYHT
jgi:hypothetical protein